MGNNLKQILFKTDKNLLCSNINSFCVDSFYRTWMECYFDALDELNIELDQESINELFKNQVIHLFNDLNLQLSSLNFDIIYEDEVYPFYGCMLVSGLSNDYPYLFDLNEYVNGRLNNSENILNQSAILSSYYYNNLYNSMRKFELTNNKILLSRRYLGKLKDNQGLVSFDEWNIFCTKVTMDVFNHLRYMFKFLNKQALELISQYNN